MSSICVFSDGGWGTALGCMLCANGHEVSLWGPFPDYIQTLQKTRVNDRFLPGVVLPDNLRLTPSVQEALDGVEIILLASPSQYLRGVLNTLKPFYKGQAIVNVAKGIEQQTLMRMSEVVMSVLDVNDYIVLSGPSHAEEVSRSVPTAVVAASASPASALRIQNVFMNPNFRVYTSDDPVGVELGGALKNVYAVAAGILDGMTLGDNPKAALMTRAIAEMARLGVALGGKTETFSGLSGIGDMIVTCCSGHSRNRHVGEALGRGQKMDEIRAAMGLSVAEGVPTAKSVHELALRHRVEVPIADAVYEILYENRDPFRTVGELMGRKPKAED